MASNNFKRALTPAECTLIEENLTIFDLPNISQTSEEGQRVLLRPKEYPIRKVLEPLIITQTFPRQEFPLLKVLCGKSEVQRTLKARTFLKEPKDNHPKTPSKTRSLSRALTARPPNLSSSTNLLPKKYDHLHSQHQPSSVLLSSRGRSQVKVQALGQSMKVHEHSALRLKNIETRYFCSDNAKEGGGIVSHRVGKTPVRTASKGKSQPGAVRT
jgi:hypothetical protein